jgi:hypothetical protein
LNAVRREGRRWASSRLSAWILYWVLVGNVDFRFAVCIALAVVIGTQLISRIGESWPSLEASSLLIFVLLAVLKNVLLGPVIPKVFRPVTEGAQHVSPFDHRGDHVRDHGVVGPGVRRHLRTRSEGVAAREAKAREADEVSSQA